MTRYLMVGSALTVMVGTSAYYGLGRSWGGPVSVTGLTVLAVAFGLLSLSSSGSARWIGLAVATSGLASTASVVVRTSSSDAPLSQGTLIPGLFIVFAVSLALFGAAGLLSGSIPGPAAIALTVGAPFLAAGVWQERLGDIGFVVTIFGLLLLGATLDLAPGQG